MAEYLDRAEVEYIIKTTRSSSNAVISIGERICDIKNADVVEQSKIDMIIKEIKAIQKEDIECDGSSDMGMVLDIIDKYIGGEDGTDSN